MNTIIHEIALKISVVFISVAIFNLCGMILGMATNYKYGNPPSLWTEIVITCIIIGLVLLAG